MILKLNKTQSEKGFFQVHMILFLGLIAVLVVSFMFLAAAARAKMKFRSQCYQQSIKLQKDIIQFEKQLFMLNPLSTALQLRLTLAKAKLALGIATLNLALFIQAETEIIQIQSHQLQLDKAQKTLIKAAEAFIQIETARLTYELNLTQFKHAQRWHQFLNIFFTVTPSQVGFAVQAASGGVAPNYELKPGYKYEQTVAYNWHFRFSSRPEAQRYLESSNSFQLSCEAVPHKKGDSWTIEIAKARY